MSLRLLVFALLTLPLGAAERYQASEPHMGTLAAITLYAENPEQAQNAFAAAFKRIRELDLMLSDYKPDSALSKACDNGPRPAELRTVLDYAHQVAAETGGAFDITAGAVTHLWREARRLRRLPAQAEIDAALARSGYRKQDGCLNGMRLDAGGIAKGFAADEALAALRVHGVRRALVAMSGDIVAGDAPPGREGWRVQALGHTLTLANQAVSTSGDEFQYLEIDGRRYSHIVDPRTGRALEDSQPVAVVARTGIEADSLATAISVGGRELARKMESKRKVRVYYQSTTEPSSSSYSAR